MRQPLNYWNEYIFLAYVNHRTDATFMAGIPDIRESLPHAYPDSQQKTWSNDG
jgi:hypothetical protein